MGSCAKPFFLPIFLPLSATPGHPTSPETVGESFIRPAPCVCLVRALPGVTRDGPPIKCAPETVRLPPYPQLALRSSPATSSATSWSALSSSEIWSHATTLKHMGSYVAANPHKIRS